MFRERAPFAGPRFTYLQHLRSFTSTGTTIPVRSRCYCLFFPSGYINHDIEIGEICYICVIVNLDFTPDVWDESAENILSFIEIAVILSVVLDLEVQCVLTPNLLTAVRKRDRSCNKYFYS